MINDFTRLDPRFVEGLTEDQVDDIFIARMFLGEDDFMTAYNMAWHFTRYPGLDTLEKVDSKTYECIKKMMHNEWIDCVNPEGEMVTCNEIIARKAEILAIMDRTDKPGDEYNFMFDYTRRGVEFMKDTMRAYRPVFDELDRLAQKDIDRREREEEKLL